MLAAWWGEHTRAYKILGLIGVICAVILAFVPLFNLIGYESAAFFGVLYGLTTSYLRFDGPAPADFGRALRNRLALIVVPFAVLTLNALVVKNCAYGIGVGWWLLIVVGSIAVATTVGWSVRHIVGDGRAGHAAIACLTLMSVADFGIRLALEPPIIGFHWFLGYFSGSIYDEALSIPDGLVWYRVTHLFAIGAVLAGLEARRVSARRLLWVAVPLAAIALALFATRANAGIDLDRVEIAEELGGVVESEHFVIHYAASSPLAQDVDRMVEDHEYRYAEMKEFFGTDPVQSSGQKVRSFVYANRGQKGELMGARRTLVAKIWLKEMHILWRYYGDHMLAHELAHVFTEPFGNGPLRLSSRYLVFANMGLVEGVATAADWNADALDPHRASAALRRLDAAPPIAALVGASGFWTQSSGRAYTLMGSFVRWLVETHGIEKFRDAYGAGEFERVYGVSPDALVAQWESYVDAIQLSDQELELARFLYDRRSIFEKVCARTVGELRTQAAIKARQRDQAAALALMEQVRGFDPASIPYALEHARLLLGFGRYEEARQVLLGLATDEVDASQRAQIDSLLGDVAWGLGRVADARTQYGKCLASAIPVEQQRLLLVKHEALSRAERAQRHAFQFLVEPDTPADLRVFFPAQWAHEHPEDPLAAYLLGRFLWSSRQWDEARPYLVRALGVAEGPLRAEATLMLVQTLHFAGEADAAQQRAQAWQPTIASYRAARREWLARIDWVRRNTVDVAQR